jgi:Tfp pilus assembly protein PilX
MLSRTTQRRVSDERGQSLVIALLVMTFLAVSLGTVMFFTAGNQRNANYQKAAQVATSLAQAGVNDGVSVLANPANSCCLTLTYAADGSGTAVLPDNKSYSGIIKHPANTNTTMSPGSTLKWWGTYAAGPQVWTLYGQATVPNPTGPTGSSIVKMVSATVQVHQPKPGNIDVGVWNTIYSPYGPSAGCDTQVAQGVNLKVPLYVGGNLCLQNGAMVNAPVYVGGFLYVNNKQAQIGCTATNGNGCTTPAPVHSAHVGSYCQVQNGGTQVNPCKSEPVQGNQPDTNIWVQSPNSWNPTGLPSDFIDPVTGQLITAPTICWAQGTCSGDLTGGWYSMASPGPLHPCTTVSGNPPVFDAPGDTVWGPNQGQPGGDVPATTFNPATNSTYTTNPFNLTPNGQSYTCQTSSGELSWNSTSKTLTVSGTIFIDGSVLVSTNSQTPITYTGTGGNCTDNTPCDGVIYATGTVYINNEKLCAVVNASNTDCDWTNWDPNAKILVFLANYYGTQQGVASSPQQGIVVGPTGTSFQGGLYANYQINTGQGAATQGPLVSGTQTVVTGQQFVGSFPPINILPISVQGPPQGFYIDPPTNFHYGS